MVYEAFFYASVVLWCVVMAGILAISFLRAAFAEK